MPNKKQAKALFNNARRLNLLVSDLLDYTRLETSHLSLTKKPFGIVDLLVETIDGFRKGCTTHSIEYEWDLEDAYILGDYIRLTQVLTNLLQNAVRYSEVGTTIKVTASLGEGNVRISVLDRGHGLPKPQGQGIWRHGIGAVHRIADNQTA